MSSLKELLHVPPEVSQLLCILISIEAIRIWDPNFGRSFRALGGSLQHCLLKDCNIFCKKNCKVPLKSFIKDWIFVFKPTTLSSKNWYPIPTNSFVLCPRGHCTILTWPFCQCFFHISNLFLQSFCCTTTNHLQSHLDTTCRTIENHPNFFSKCAVLKKISQPTFSNCLNKSNIKKAKSNYENPSPTSVINQSTTRLQNWLSVSTLIQELENPQCLQPTKHFLSLCFSYGESFYTPLPIVYNSNSNS